MGTAANGSPTAKHRWTCKSLLTHGRRLAGKLRALFHLPFALIRHGKTASVPFCTEIFSGHLEPKCHMSGAFEPSFPKGFASLPAGTLHSPCCEFWRVCGMGGEQHDNVHLQKQATSQVPMCCFDGYLQYCQHLTLRDLIQPQ